MSSPRDAQLEAFERFCRDVLVLEQGGPFILEGWQKKMLADYFAGVRETLILIPKKNGKTTLLAALGIFHLLTTPDADCVIVAASREQAGTMLRQASGFIRRSEVLQARLNVFKREIAYEKLGGRIRIVASDVDTVQGWIGTLALVDEMGHHKDDDLYGVFRDGLGPRKGQMLGISTAGDDESSSLGVFRARLHARPGFVREGAYRHVVTQNQALHEWALDAGEDLEDIELVKSANPASWQTVEELRIRQESDSMRPWQWARFACGAWVAGENAAIAGPEWGACADPAAVIPADTEGVFVGVDLGRRWDTTAVIAVWKPDPEEPARVEVIAIIPSPQDGTATSEEDIWDAFEEACDKWPKVTFVIDPNLGGDIFAERLDQEFPNARFAVFNQGYVDLCRMAQQLADAIAEGQIRHPDDRRLNAHVLAAAAKAVGEKWRFVKQKRKNLPIDGVIALAMAHSTLLGEGSKPSREVLFM